MMRFFQEAFQNWGTRKAKRFSDGSIESPEPTIVMHSHQDCRPVLQLVLVAHLVLVRPLRVAPMEEYLRCEGYIVLGSEILCTRCNEWLTAFQENQRTTPSVLIACSMR